MTGELSQEQVAEIRRVIHHGEFLTRHEAVALCDTVELLRAELRGAERALEGELLMESRSAARERDSLEAKVETLRGIARRFCDGWEHMHHGMDDTHYWRHRERDLHERMSPAEVQAIYGEKETHG